MHPLSSPAARRAGYDARVNRASHALSSGAGAALAAAALFGAGTPLAKLLLGRIDPWMLAALLPCS